MTAHAQQRVRNVALADEAKSDVAFCVRRVRSDHRALRYPLSCIVFRPSEGADAAQVIVSRERRRGLATASHREVDLRVNGPVENDHFAITRRDGRRKNIVFLIDHLRGVRWAAADVGWGCGLGAGNDCEDGYECKNSHRSASTTGESKSHK